MDQHEQELYGLPTLDRTWYWATVKIGAGITPKATALRKFNAESRLLIELAEDADITPVSQRVKIPRILGMPPSSCHWSLLMVLDHMRLLLTDMKRLISGLSQGTRLTGRFSHDQYEPDPDIDLGIIQRFTDTANEFQLAASGLANLRGNRCFRHSWLGLLNAHQWLCWTTTYTRMRRSHATQIRNAAGVV